MKKLTITLVSIIFLTGAGLAQETSTFTPGGKPFALVYTNLHYTTSGGEGSPAFEIKRAYLGYDYKFSPNFSAKINIDVDNPGVGKLQMTAFLKNAYLQYSKNKFDFYFGMISTLQFKVQEKFWGKRWIAKSFQDEYKMGPSADIGMSAAYDLSDFASIDAWLVNGEGYKLIQADNSLRAGLGLTLKPAKGLTARIYADHMKDTAAQQTLATFIGYQAKTFSLAGEYNYQLNNEMKAGNDFSGWSFYTSINLVKSFKFFGRYDNLSSVTKEGADMPWNLSKDGQLFMAGIEFSPIKGVKVAPGFHGWKPANTDKDFVSGLYLNFEYNF